MTTTCSVEINTPSANASRLMLDFAASARKTTKPTDLPPLPPPPLPLYAAPPLGRSEKSVEEIVAKQAAIGWSAALCPITHCFGPELEMRRTTEQEEKRLLREQLHGLEVLVHTCTHMYTHVHTCTHMYSQKRLLVMTTCNDHLMLIKTQASPFFPLQASRLAETTKLQEEVTKVHVIDPPIDQSIDLLK